LKIRWTKRALKNLDSTIDYLMMEWGVSSVQKLSNKVLRVLSAVENNPQIGTIVFEDKAIRGIILTKHNTLFYRIKDNEIIILQVFDNRSNPHKSLK
jgi:plasmid stabilization system protein ParE